jgi:hypothetical protein
MKIKKPPASRRGRGLASAVPPFLVFWFNANS